MQACVNTKTHLHADAWPCVCIHKCTKSTHTPTVAVLSCTATHCVYAEPLSLLVERGYALLTSAEENIELCPLVIHWCQYYPPLHLPLSSGTVCVWCAHEKGDFHSWSYGRNSQWVTVIEKLGHFLLVKDDQKWKRRLPDANKVPATLMEVKAQKWFCKKIFICDSIFQLFLTDVLI